MSIFFHPILCSVLTRALVRQHFLKECAAVVFCSTSAENFWQIDVRHLNKSLPWCIDLSHQHLFTLIFHLFLAVWPFVLTSTSASLSAALRAILRACILSWSGLSNSLQLHGLQLLCSWNFSGKTTGMVVISSSEGSSWPRNRTCTSCTAGGTCTPNATAMQRTFKLSDTLLP